MSPIIVFVVVMVAYFGGLALLVRAGKRRHARIDARRNLLARLDRECWLAVHPIRVPASIPYVAPITCRICGSPGDRRYNGLCPDCAYHGGDDIGG